MGDIGEETHIHLIDLLLLLPFHCRLLLGFPFFDELAPVHNYYAENGDGQDDVEGISPPGAVQRSPYAKIKTVFSEYIRLLDIGNSNFEDVFAGWDIGVIRLPVGAGIYPVFVIAFKHVGVAYPFVLAVVQGGEGNRKTVFAVFELDFRVECHCFTDAATFGRHYCLVVHFQFLETEGNSPVRHQLNRIEQGHSMRASENQSSARENCGGPVVELVASNTVGFEPVDEAPHTAVVFGKPGLSADP